MIILGVDYGRRKIGLALSEGGMAQPLGVAKVTSSADAAEKIRQAMAKHSPDLIVLGVSEGEMAKEQREFAKLLARKVVVAVKTWDETLTTMDAKGLALSAGIGRSKRQKLEDAYAATLMLQSYLDHGTSSSP